MVYINHINNTETMYNQNLSCASCNISYEELEPRFFSFNSPQGACIKCLGLGSQMTIDPDLMVPDKKQSLLTGCLVPIGEQPQSNWVGQIIKSLLEKYNYSYSTPWYQLPNNIKRIILYGTNKQTIIFFSHMAKRQFKSR